MKDGQGWRRSFRLTTKPLKGRKGSSGVGIARGVQHPLLRPPVPMEEPTRFPAAGMQPYTRWGGGETGQGWEPAASLPRPVTASTGHDIISKASHSWQPQASWIPATQLLGDLCSAWQHLEGTAEVRASLIIIMWRFQNQLKPFSLSFCPH